MDFATYLQALLSLIAVLALIGVLAWAARRYGLGGAPARRGGRVRRLGIVEVLPIDARRRLVLIRRDDVEHLVLTGAGPDLLVEAGIAAPPANAEVSAPAPTVGR